MTGQAIDPWAKERAEWIWARAQSENWQDASMEIDLIAAGLQEAIERGASEPRGCSHCGAFHQPNERCVDEPMACCGLKPSEGHNGCCTFYGEDVQAIMAACSRVPHPDAPGAARAARDLIREIERVVEKARARISPPVSP